MTVQTADLTKSFDQFLLHRYLFDGQTKEMLAAASMEKGKKMGHGV
jgi:hypothetical protein